MRGSKIGIASISAAIIIIVIALVLKFSIVEGMKQWPDDANTTRLYQGQLILMLNTEALEEMDLTNIFIREIPIDISRHYTTEKISGNKAIVREIINVSDLDGGTIISKDNYYALDRKTMEAIPNFDDKYDVPYREGLAFQFPIGGAKKDYMRWVSDLQESSAVIFVGEENRGSLNTYVFESIVEPAEIKDPAVLNLLPKTLPSTIISMMIATFDLPEDHKSAIEDLLSDLPDEVPLRYLYNYEAKYWVEPISGINIDIERYEARTVAIENGEEIIPLTNIFEIDYKTTEISIQEAIDDAKEIKAELTLWGSTIPYVLIAVGVVMVIIGFAAIVRTRQR